MTVTTSEQGVVATDHRLHAAIKGLRGTTARCGAGAIATLTPGRFDTDDPDACSDCVAEFVPQA